MSGEHVVQVAGNPEELLSLSLSLPPLPLAISTLAWCMVSSLGHATRLAELAPCHAAN